ncbi:MAG: carboxymuconolactone decarboxylase family protein [Proteobacteria bacterium]|nr:carboxymuconolactone decarboxylase family protein [Pseudomonadota bacterium]
MSIESLKSALPDYAKDLKLNLSNVLATPGMTPAQLWGTALAAALAARNPTVIRAVAVEAAQHVDAPTLSAAKTAAAVMAMNNVYYRFTHLASTPDYRTMPARLRMNALTGHGAAPLDFELWSLAASAINGCGLCIDSHEREVVKKGASKELVQNVVRLAAVIQAVAVTLEGADALAEAPAA